ncbi:MAG: hypothetical protein IJV65_04725, partial [Kiritimatiellae bacterium]|nr:hypothetical protein [Kiritimatiellia bacterium]
GADGNWNDANRAPSGHAGGSGTVIVRWRSMPESTILVETEAPAGGFRRGTFAGSVTSAGGAGATVDVEIGVALAGSAVTNWTTVATGLKAGDAFSAAIDGLADNRTYAAAWRASNVFASATGDAGSFATYAGAYLVPGAGAEGATVTQVGNDSIYTYSNPATAGTFTVQRAGYARVLVVGGGGAGGHYHGGGGGGGGVIEEDLVWLEAGTYDISVGAGGASSAWGVRGGNGGDSVVSLGGAERWRAYGGGGGGSWTDNEIGLGGNGGSGGGSARRRETTAGNPIDPAQGHPGAPSRRRDLGNVDDRWSAGGGGGAGSPGVQASADHTVAGAGGAGRTSDISGSAQQYGAGGGASCTDLDANAAGEGGDGIGGHGRRNENTQYWVGDEPGRAGYGGGGGGGADRDWNSNFIRPGAPGGCGTVIIRFANAPAGKPDAAVVAAAPAATDPAGADVEILVRSLGNAASATLELAYGASQGSLPLRQAVGTVTAAGTVDALLSGLEPGKTYYVAAAIRTAAGETVTRAVPVTIPAAGAGAGEAGLWQTVWGAPLPAADADVWAQSLSSNVVAGAIASIGTGLSLDPFSGETYAWGGAPVCFLYKGAIFLKGGTTYTFGSQMDDTVRLVIGGTTLIDLEASPSTTTFADFTPPHTGWYPVEIRLGNATGDRAKHGPDGDGTTTWANFALAFNTEGSRSMIPEGAWTTLLDPGDGSLLRPEMPELRYSDLDKYVEAQNLTVTATVAPGDQIVHAYLCSGAAWGGNDPYDWDEYEDLGEVAAANAATALDPATVAGWGTTAKVAAVALVHPDGTVTWSAPVTYAGTSLLALGAAATDWSQGDELEVSFTVAGGTGPYKATLYVGNGPGSLSKAATTTLASAGTGTLRATGLTPSATYYWQVVVTDAAGGSAATDDSANVMMPGAAEILNTSSGISWSLDQRTVTFNGNLKTLGAGDNWALLYLTDRLYERWPNDTRAFRGSTTNSEIKVQLTQTGPFSITHTFDWNQEIGFNWVLSNSNGRVTWVGSRKPDWNGNDAAAQAHFWTGDYQTYTWNGGSGVWNDTAMWTPDGTMEGHEQAGYPVTGSYFMFPEGTHEVTIPAGGDKVESGVSMFRPTSFYLQKNAKVTLKATPESAALQLTQTDYPLRQHTIDIPEGAELVVSGVKGRWWTVRDNWSGFYFNGPNTLLEFTDGAEIDMGNGYGSWVISSWNDGSKVGRRFVVSDGAKLTLRGRIVISGPQVFTIDDGQVWMTDATWQDDNSITFAFTEGGRLVFRGAHPLLVANRRFYADTGNNPNGDALQFIDFEIPAAGFAEAPLRTHTANTTVPFGDGGNANRRLVLRVPTNAPAATAKVVLDQPIVWWPAGTNACVLIDDAYLPHPDTDYWYETFDDLTGAFTGWGVHLVGRPASEAPQIVGLSLTNIVEGAAGFDFYGIPGDNAASATFTVSIARTDDPDDTTAAVSLVPAGGTVTAGTRFAVAATGLARGGTYCVTVTGVDPSDSSKTCAETLEFDALRDYAEATASADAVVTQDGPYTVWTFTNTAAASTFTLTRPGTARILVVGGGGSGGGSDRSDENTGETRRGGGGGAGGEVLETELYLQAGEYPVVVGAGGAGTTVNEVGKQGGWSTFGYLATAYGGGGGGAWAYRNNTWNNYVDSGANGGGAGGQGAAGGAVTSASGHTGGVGTYNAWANWTDRYAGGGGGSTAGVGGDAGLDALNMFVAGDGADGVPSDITGSVVYYGGGGGGGCAGLRFGPGNGGRGGKGGGGEGRAWRNATAFATDAAQGADGFGGGGGGGSSCGVSGVDAALQAYRGGKGGSGVVIVRMLTSTLETADPVVSLKTAEPATGGLDLDFTVHSFGGDALSADLFFAWGEGGALSHTNDLGTVSATGAVSRAVAGLKPGTAYAGQLVVDNGEGGRTAIPVSFRTAGESHADADSGLVTGAWTVSAWPENDT